jgi:hypothetical protein
MPVETPLNPLQQSIFEERFTDVHDAIRYVKEIESMDLKRIDYCDLEKKIYQYFPIFPFNSAGIPVNTLLFRARLCVGDMPFDRLDEISVPPEKLITKFGRANKPGESIFYCASNLKLAAFETVQHLKESLTTRNGNVFITLGIWRVIKPLHVAPIIHSPILHQVRKDIAKAFREHQDLMNLGILKQKTITSHQIVSQFYADQFTKENIRSHDDYKISALFANSLHRANNDIATEFLSERYDGVNYPSVATRYKGDNQAIFIEALSTKMEFHKAIHLMCRNFNFVTGEFEAFVPHETIGIKNGTFKWRRNNPIKILDWT